MQALIYIQKMTETSNGACRIFREHPSSIKKNRAPFSFCPSILFCNLTFDTLAARVTRQKEYKRIYYPFTVTSTYVVIALCLQLFFFCLL